jgi:hypothetical protein
MTAARCVPRILPVVFLLVSPFWVRASHLRAAEVTAEQVSCDNPYLYRITVTAYLNTFSGTAFGGESETDGHFSFGDGSIHLIPYMPATPRPDLGRGVGIATYSTEHLFAAPGMYRVHYIENDRNGNIVNLPNSHDVPMSTYIEIYIDPEMGCNSSPRLTIPPVDRTCPGVAFLHNPGANDPEGDSISYALSIPYSGRDTPANGYRDPDDPAFYTNYNTANEKGDGPPEFTIDPVTGIVTWDASQIQGEYNIAFQIIEWRRHPVTLEYVVLTVTVRDMQIIVEDCDNRRPDIVIPIDTCVEAGAVLSKKVIGTDPESDSVKIEVISELFDLSPSPATVTPDSSMSIPSNPPATVQFDWATDCMHVREQPYQVVFRISDAPANGPSLVTYKTWRIRVTAPAPEWKNVEVDFIKRYATLEWEPYACPNAAKIQIWRRVGTAGYAADACLPGVPPFYGYELVGEVDPSKTSFTDTNRERGLAVGAQYCYRILAVFPLPQGGRSYASEEFCVGPIRIDAPLITQVSVEKTDDTAGTIRVGWWSPLEIDRTQFPGPYEYEVYRGEGLASEDIPVNVSGRIRDTTFVDTNLDTEAKAYHYTIVLYSNAQNNSEYFPLDTSATASSVRLGAQPGDERIVLTWEAIVPWSNVAAENRRHLIYRGLRGVPEKELILIDSVDVTANGFHYVDNGKYSSQGIDPDEQYCYRIVTRGTYGNATIGILENSSQMVCLYPNNDLLPCPPVLHVKLPDCEQYIRSETCNNPVLANTLSWNRPKSGCREDIVSYNVLEASTPDGEFVMIASVTDTTHVDSGLNSQARCYRVEAVDALGRVSEPSEVVCGDNCPYFELPNVFTPNGDACNDHFSAWFDPSDGGEVAPCVVADVTRCPRFVKEVDLLVYNRWGQEVYHFSSATDGNVVINWDGKDNDGTALEAAVYYYVARVEFDVLDPASRQRTYKGWVHLKR